MKRYCLALKRVVQLVFAVQIVLFCSAKLLLVYAQQPEASTQASHSSSKKLDILYAVNCGGEEHVDHSGVLYRGDPGVDGIASDYGTRWQIISNAHPEDFILYQTERYADSTFGYDIPLPKSPSAQNYVLVLKFAEVYFNQPGMKIFDVLLNGDHIVVDGLDIFERAGGRASAYDVMVQFRLTGNKLLLINTGEESDFTGILRLDFVKTSQDNPKCNAFFVARGTLDDIPKQEFRRSILDDEKERDLQSESPFRDTTEFEDDVWSAPEHAFPAPGLALEEDIGFERYYPVISVFVFIAVLTLFLFKL